MRAALPRLMVDTHPPKKGLINSVISLGYVCVFIVLCQSAGLVCVLLDANATAPFYTICMYITL